ncbi:MAG: threonine/serine exporter family protein, partial [Thermoleophilia bacterium]
MDGSDHDSSDQRFDPAGDPRVEFLCAAGAALARYGASTNRLERRLAASADALGVEAQFYMLPTAIFAAFGGRSNARTVLISTEEVSVDLRGLTAVGEVLAAVAKGELDPQTALDEVHRLTSPPPRYAWYWRILATGLSAAAIVVLLGGGRYSLLPSALVGLAVGGLIAIGLKVERLVPLLELLAGILAAGLAAALWNLLPHFALDVVVLAGLTPLVPGLAITRGV